MLVLGRRTNEEIIIGNDKVRIKVISIIGNQVKLGFCAEKNISIHRLEIFEKIKNGKGEKTKELKEKKITKRK